MDYSKMENELNAKILKITMKIQEQYPELSKYLEEMPITVPSEENQEITLNNLRTYYESLEKLLAKYKKEKPMFEEKENMNKEISNEKPNPKDPNEIQGFPNNEDTNPGEHPEIKE